MTFKRLKKKVRRIFILHPMESISLLIGLIVLIALMIVSCSMKAFNEKPSEKQPSGSSESPTPTPTDVPVESPTISLSLPSATPTPTGFVYVPGQCESVTSDKTISPIERDDWETDPLMLVNWDNYLKYTGKPANLVLMKDYMTDSRYHFDAPDNASGNEAAVIALNQMCVDAMNAGCSNVKFSANGTYRDYKKQNGFWQQHIDEDPNYGADPYRNPPKTVPPMCSEHRTGLGFDIWMIEYDYEWLHNNCYKYGFILRYPADKLGYTGVMYEQWHFRYVGVEAATEMRRKNFCLEEYIAFLNGETITPHPTASPTPSPSPAPTGTQKPTPTPGASATPTPTKEPDISPSPVPTDSVTPSPTIPLEPTPSIPSEPTPTVPLEPSPTTPAEPSPTETPVPTDTPVPTPTTAEEPDPASSEDTETNE